MRLAAVVRASRHGLAVALVLAVSSPATALCALDARHDDHASMAEREHHAPSSALGADAAPADPAAQPVPGPECQQKCSSSGVVTASRPPLPAEGTPGAVESSPTARGRDEPRRVEHVPIG